MPDPKTLGARMPFWRKIPDAWKIVVVLLAIGGTSIAGYAKLDDERDAMNDRIDALERAYLAADAALAGQVGGLNEDMVRAADLEGYILKKNLQAEYCRQNLRAQRHEFQALYKAYEELISTVVLAEKTFASLPRTEAIERHEDEVLVLRSGLQSRRRGVERELRALDDRLNLEGGC